MSVHRLTPLFCLFLVVALASVACTSARRKVDGDIVHRVDFEGIGPPFVRPFSKAELRSAMSQKQSGLGVRTPGLSWAARAATLDRTVLDDDTYRLESWLAHRGHFDARVDGWRIIRKRRQRLRRDGTIRKAGVVNVVGQVTFNEPSTVRKLDVVWLDKEADRFWRSAQEGLAVRTSFAQPDTTFNLDYVDWTVNDLVRRMQENGYLYAEAQARIEAYPEDHAVDILIEAKTGVPTTFGPIEIEGNERVPTELIRTVLNLHEGDTLLTSALQEGQQRLIGTDVFSLVRIEPDKSDPTVREVPVKVAVKEGRFGTARFGFGTVYDGTTITPRLSTTIENSNIDRKLARFEAGANVGWGIPLQGGVDSSRILYGFNTGIIRPDLFRRTRDGDATWDATSSFSYQRDLLAGQLLFTRARLAAGFAHHFTEDVSLSFGPAAEVVRLGPGSIFTTSDANLTDLDKLLVTATYGGNPDSVRNPFFLPVLEGRLVMDWRKGENVALDPRGGYYYQFGVRQAVPFGPNSLRFTDLSAEARFYRSPVSRGGNSIPYTFALRMRGKWLPGRADDFQDSVPFSERAFLGGSFDMRSFRINQVGPYDCVCLAEEEPIVSGPFWPFTQDTGGTRLEANPTYLPRGGRFAGLVTGEIRRRWDSGRGLALFGDLGMLARSFDEVKPRYWPNSLRFGGGIGFRQQTPVGPVRIDLAVRPRYPEDEPPQRADLVTVATDPSDPTYYQGQYYGCDDIPDSRLPSRSTGILSNNLDLPVIVNLAIAIGEAL